MIKKKIKRNKLNEINWCFLLLIIFFNFYIFSIYLWEEYKIIKLISIVILFLFSSLAFFIDEKIKKKDLKIIIFLIIFALILPKFYISFYAIIISKFIKDNKKLEFLLFLSIFFYLLTLILSKFGYLEVNNLKSTIRYFEGFKVFRHTLGFNHPNTTMSLLLPIFFLLYYLYYDKAKILIPISIFIIGKIVFNYTYSRTTFLLILLFIVLILANDKYIKKLKTIFCLESGIIIFFTFFLPYYFKNTFLNKLFSGRLVLFYNYLTKFQITFLGNKEIIEYYKLYPLDNVYLRTLFENGIIGFILLIILISYTMKILFKNKDYRAIRIFSIVLIFGFMESTALFYYFNIIYFIIPDYIFTEKE